MEPADIDWNNLEWRFERDDVYEHFNAPKWLDLENPSPKSRPFPVDEAWFCRSDCRHPKTAEDFLSVEKHSGKNCVLRDTNLKRRVGASPLGKLKISPEDFDLENQDPNLCTTPVTKKLLKKSIKSSAEKVKLPPAKNPGPKYEILALISEFCNEIKKLALFKRDRSDLQKELIIKETTIRKEKTKRPGVLQEIRFSPPTPQRIAFSPRDSTKKCGVQEDEDPETIKDTPSSESKTIDLFWFLRPCL